MAPRQASKLSRKLHELVATSGPNATQIQTGIAKLLKYGERAAADLDVETFRHEQLRKQVANKPAKAKQDRRILTKARVITNIDIIRLREQQEKIREGKVAKSKNFTD